jgi:hypothetical protein
MLVDVQLRRYATNFEFSLISCVSNLFPILYKLVACTYVFFFLEKKKNKKKNVILLLQRVTKLHKSMCTKVHIHPIYLSYI